MMFSEADAGSSSIYISHGSAQEGNTILCSSYETHGRVFLTYAGRFVYVTSMVLARYQGITCFVAENSHCRARYTIKNIVMKTSKFLEYDFWDITEHNLGLGN